MSRNDGGAAFPLGANEYAGHGPVPGMSLRDYFIAHAPTDPQSWFEPVMAVPCPPEPACTAEISQILSGRMVAGWISDSVIEELEGDCKLFAEARRRIWVWNIERDKQRLIQWPAAWADAQIELRAKQMGSDV